MDLKYAAILAIAVLPALAGGLMLTGCKSSSAQPEPVIQKVDHVVMLSNDPHQLFTLLTGTLGLPVAWPFAEYPGFASGGVQMGNVNIETIHFAEGSPLPYPGSPPVYRDGRDASLFGIVLEPYSLPTLSDVLRARGALPGAPSDQMGEYEGHPVRLWTNMFLQALGLDSYVVYTCEYSPGYKALLSQHRATPPLGNIGLLSIREIVVGAKDLPATLHAWDRLLAPVRSVESRYEIGSGPALRFVEATDNRIISLVLEVGSLQTARSVLEQAGLLGSVSENEISIDPSRVQALDIRIVEKKQ